MTLEEFIEGLKAAADEYGRIDAYVSGAKLLGKLVADLEPIASGETGEPITLARAAGISGYSVEHIGRLVRQGKVRNIGRKGAPRVLARDLPRRPGCDLPHAQLNCMIQTPTLDSFASGGKEHSNGSETVTYRMASATRIMVTLPRQ